MRVMWANEYAVAPVLQALGKFIFHSRSKRQFYALLNPDKIHNEMMKLSQNMFGGKPVAVAACLKGNPSCARLLACSHLSTTLTDRKRYDHTHLIEITAPEKGTRYGIIVVSLTYSEGVTDIAHEIEFELVQLERPAEKISAAVLGEEATATVDIAETQKILKKILQLLSKDDDIDDTLHEIAERGLNRLFRPFGGAEYHYAHITRHSPREQHRECLQTCCAYSV